MSELKKLTPEQKRDYVKDRSGNCPYCGSMDLDGGSFEMSGTSVSQHISCLGCGREWDDVYKLVSIDEDGQSETPDHPEVIVVVSGGNVQGAKANTPDVDVHILDYDNMKAAKEEPAAKDEYDYLVELEQRWENMEFAVL